MDAVKVKEPYRLEDWQVTLAETGLERMTGCRVKRIEKYLDGDHFLLTYGDGVSDIDITRSSTSTSATASWAR